MLIMGYESGDLVNYIISNFYNTVWNILNHIIGGLFHIHSQKIVHRLYSNPYSKHPAVISDLGISK